MQADNTDLTSSRQLFTVSSSRFPQSTIPTLVLFGATGDLATNKLLPAIYDLYHNNQLPSDFLLIGFARRNFDHESFRIFVKQNIESKCRNVLNHNTWTQLQKRIFFVSGNFDDPLAYAKLKDLLVQKNHLLNTGIDGAATPQSQQEIVTKCVFYLSVAPGYLRSIADRLHHLNCDSSSVRFVIEKPFGSSLASSRKLNAYLESRFDAKSIFRIDHYLAKETVQNILALRFANTFFDKIWNAGSIDHIQITMAEDIGISSRAEYYDSVGAARDVIQNHLLQLLALIAMEEPVDFNSQAISAEKQKLLSCLHLPKNIQNSCARGQYGGLINGDIRAFLDEPGVKPDSKTETYAALKLYIHNRRWMGVPFFIRSGKRLRRRITEIALFMHPSPLYLFANENLSNISQNQLIIRIQPNEGATIKFAAKIPGGKMLLKDVSMDMTYSQSFKESGPSAYERLILDALLGDSMLFTTYKEVDLSWQILDPVLQYWNDSNDLEIYPPGSQGPQSANKIIEKDARCWRPI